MTATNRIPWFVGNRAFVPGYPFEWVLMLLVGEYAVIGKLAEAQVLGMGSFTRMVPVERLVRPGQWDAASLSQVKAVPPKAIPGERYQSGLNHLAIYVGLKDGRFYDTQTGLIWAHDDEEILRRELQVHPLPVFFAND